MDTGNDRDGIAMRARATLERISERELVVTRLINGPAHLVYEAWTRADLFRQWWVPRSIGATLLSCELDVRTGGHYRLVFANGDAEPLAFFGRYLEVTPPTRIVWTNDESAGEGPITTVTFEAHGDSTRLILHERFPSKAALDAALASGEKDGLDETFDQLDELLAWAGDRALPHRPAPSA